MLSLGVEPARHGTKLAFGTEAGLFARRLKTPALVCGPGSIEQAHEPGEFIHRDQIEACDRLLDRRVDHLCDPA